MKKISVTPDNRLKIENEQPQSTKIIDFNEYYKGYYPGCTFTAAVYGNGIFYAAGTDENGIPHLFISIGGDVWNESNIESRLNPVRRSSYGDIIRILIDEKDHQAFLATRNGYLVTIPDCEKCVRVKKVCELCLQDAKMEDEIILLKDENGDEQKIPLGFFKTFRCAWSFAKPFIDRGGVLIDLRKPEYNTADLETVLDTYPQSTFLFFLCENGSRADAAAQEARSAGYSRAYSLGSAADLGL